MGAKLEGHVAGVDGVRTTVHEDALHIHDGIACERTFVHGCCQTLLDRGDVFLRNHAALGDVDELETTARVRLEADDGMGKLALAAGLLGVLVVALEWCGDGLAERHRRRTHRDRHLELFFQAVHNDFQMQLAHARNDGLFGLFVEMGAERRVFVAKFGQSLTKFVAVFLIVQIDFHFDNRRRYVDGFQQDRLFVFLTKGVARLGVFHAHESNDFARASLGDFLAFLRLDAENAAHTLAFHLIGVVNAHAVHQLAAKDADEGLLAHIRVVDKFKGQSGKRFIFRGVALVSLLLIGGVVRDDGTQVIRRRQVIHDGVQKELDTFIFIGGTTKHRHHHQFDGGLADGGHQFFCWDFLVF